MKKIEINWTGPFTIGEVFNMHGDTDFGIYQIYGTHNILGPDTLVYIGKAFNQTFGSRMMNKDREWAKYEFHDFKFYLGKLGGKENVDDVQWTAFIDEAERILIDHCIPPFNSQINNLIDHLASDIFILNYGKRHRLPFIISTIWKASDHNAGIWQAYTNKKYSS